ncbi:hypothetical protein BC751_1318 [Cecembia calidifontis]|uniref:Uncharacterized protein n=1 Tax=Cecembia calidifontis TaxID=1187080 RepID=A0A4Q7P6Q1_9BACT|nr:hypothetical protein BC751_1318 [Cecembia calidifontis]
MKAYNFQKLQILRSLCDHGGNTLVSFAVKKWVHAMNAKDKRKGPNESLQLPEITNSKKPLRPWRKNPCVLCGYKGFPYCFNTLICSTFLPHWISTTNTPLGIFLTNSSILAFISVSEAMVCGGVKIIG